MSKSEDAKIMAIVAGIVLLGVVGVAVIGGIGSAEEDATPSSPAVRSSTPRATLAGHEAGSPTAATAIPELPRPVAEPAEAPFRVTPGENYVARGLETFDAREFDKAVAYFTAETNERPGRAWTDYMLGLSLWKAGRLDEASQAMRRSAGIDPDSVKTFVNLARIENDRGEFDEALTAARTALAIAPDDAEALLLEGRSLRNGGERELALASLRRSVEIGPDNGQAQNLLGLTLHELERHDEARVAFERAAELEPGVAYIHNNLGMALEHTDRREDAVLAYQRAVELDAGHDRAAANLARLDPAGEIRAAAVAAAQTGSEDDPGSDAPDTVAAEEVADSVVVADAADPGDDAQP